MSAIKAWIIKDWSLFDRWMHAHPYKACIDVAFAAILAGFIASSDRWRWTIGLPAFALYLIPSTVKYWLDCKKLTAAAMIFALGFLTVTNGNGQALLPDLPQEAVVFPPGLIEQVPQGELEAAHVQCYVIAFVIILVVLTIVLYTIIREADRVPPPPPPDEEGSYEDTDAGSFVQVPEREFEYCQTLSAASGVTPTVVELDIAIEATDLGPAARLKIGKSYTDENRLTDTQGLKESLAKWGLDFDPNAKGAQYAHNGQQVNAWESPIGFIENSRGVIPTFSRGGIPYPMILEESEDLAHWQFLFETRVEAGNTVRIVDTSPTRQRFYRLRTALP